MSSSGDIDFSIQAEFRLGRIQLENGHSALLFWENCRKKYPIELLLDVTEALENIKADLFDLYWSQYFLYHEDLIYVLKFLTHVKFVFEGAPELRLLSIDNSDCWWGLQKTMNRWVDDFRRLFPAPEEGDNIGSRITSSGSVEASISSTDSVSVLKVKLPGGVLGKVEIEIE